MALSDTALRNAKPADKPYKLYDERGLYLIVNPKGGKWWRLTGYISLIIKILYWAGVILSQISVGYLSGIKAFTDGCVVID